MAYGKFSKPGLKAPSAELVFTDREEPRAILSHFFSKIFYSKVQSKNYYEAPLLNFYGVGGVGKSTLLKKSRSEFENRFSSDTSWLGVHVGFLDLQGLPLGENIPGHYFLWKLRNVIHHDMLTTPLFDSVFALIWQTENPGIALEIPRSTAKDWFDIGLSNLTDLAECTMVVKWSMGLWKKAVNNYRNNQIRDLVIGQPPSEWDHRTRIEALLRLLWQDIYNAFEKNGVLRVALLIDEFEKIQTQSKIERGAETLLVELIGELFACDVVKNRFAVVVMGREKLRWNCVYREPIWEQWIDSHILGGLSKNDAQEFLLNRIAPWFKANGYPSIAEQFETRCDYILDEARSEEVCEQAGVLPFHLDLFVHVACNELEGFTPELLSNSGGHAELEFRFLRYLKHHDEKRLAAYQTLALSQTFNKELFAYLVNENVIGSYLPSQFDEIVGGTDGETFSYISSHPSIEGYFIFHRQMQLSLINSILNNSYGSEGAKERLTNIIEYYLGICNETYSGQSAQNRIIAFQICFGILSSEPSAQLIKPEELLELADQLRRSCDATLAVSMQEPLIQWATGFSIGRLGAEHPITLNFKNFLANVLERLGKRLTAQTIHEEVLDIRRRIFGSEHEGTLQAMISLGCLRRDLGDLATAKTLIEEALKTAREVFGFENELTLKAMNSLANVLRDLGDLVSTKLLFEEVLETSRRAFGQEDVVTLRAMNSLASVLRELGDLEAARNLMEVALNTGRRVFGSEHKETLFGIVSLAILQRDLGDLAAARHLFEEALDTHRRIFGLEDIGTLKAMNSLASVFRELGELEAAKNLIEEALDTSRRVFGSEHKETLWTMASFAILLRDLGEMEAARTLLEEALRTSRLVFGTEHKNTLMTTVSLANVLRDLGKREAAKLLLEETLQISRRVFGSEHKNTLSITDGLASVLRDLGEMEAAKFLLENALSNSRRVFGPEHKNTLSNMTSLAAVLRDIGEFDAAKLLLEEALEINRRIFGLEHRNTLMAMTSLASVHRNLKNTSEAKILLQEALDTSRRVFGSEHKATLMTMNSLASVLRDSRDQEGAKALLEEALNASRRVFGSEHKTTIMAINSLASVLRDSGENDAARVLLDEALDSSRRVFGREHKTTLSSMSNLAAVLQNLGHREAAKELLEEALDANRRIFGHEHKNTLSIMTKLASMLRDLGEFGSAKLLFEEASNTYRRIFGAEHKNTLYAMKRLSDVIRAIRRSDASERS